VRVFFVTNVLIAAILSNGLCHELLEYSVACHEIVLSEFVLAELHEKLTEKFKVSSDSADRSIQLLREQSEVIGEASLDESVSRDPDDDNVLAAALLGECQVIVTGDKDLLVLGEFAKILILTPRQFFDSAGPGLSLNS